MTPMLVALARVAERRIRTSRRVRKIGRTSMAMLARVSSNARAFVQLRLMSIV
jgi:hypothetical protein